MFNNDNFNTNGEKLFYSKIKNDIKIIFDVGCRDGNFSDFEGDVHYFDPIQNNIDNLKKIQNKHSFSKFNVFGLGQFREEKYFYPEFGSFIDRSDSVKITTNQKHLFKIERGDNYVLENNITKIDFLKIDTEGFELEVMKGFGDFLNNVKIIQFEYGGTYLDAKITLLEVKNYLEGYGFSEFSYLTPSGTSLIEDFSDHYQYSNIVCFNKK